jgi:hypothetical protein
VHYAYPVIPKHKAPTEAAEARHAADTELAGQFDEMLAEARLAEQALRTGQAAAAPEQELWLLGKRLDTKLTAVMRAAFAAQRATIGPRGYEDRIYRRKAMATPPVRTWTMEAQRLLTLRECHLLTGIVRLPRTPTSVPPERGTHGLH